LLNIVTRREKCELKKTRARGEAQCEGTKFTPRVRLDEKQFSKRSFFDENGNLFIDQTSRNVVVVVIIIFGKQ